MIRRLKHLLPTNQPQEVTFFLFLAVFGLGVTVVYFIVSRELAGTALLAGFVLATGLIGLKLAFDPASERVRTRSDRAAADAVDRAAGPDVTDRRDPGGEGPAAEGTGFVDRPFLDEGGRLPAETLAPLALGAGLSIASTGLIFGLAPVLVGLLPALWGAWTWLSGATDELDAVVRDETRDDAREALARQAGSAPDIAEDRFERPRPEPPPTR